MINCSDLVHAIINECFALNSAIQLEVFIELRIMHLSISIGDTKVHSQFLKDFRNYDLMTLNFTSYLSQVDFPLKYSISPPKSLTPHQTGVLLAWSTLGGAFSNGTLYLNIK